MPRSSPLSSSDLVITPSALTHIETLLSLINAFPTFNPTPAPHAQSTDPKLASTADVTSNTDTDTDTDLAASLERIRARYRLLCSSLGIRPRLATSQQAGQDEGEGEAGASGVVQGIEGPMKGVDTKLLRF